MFIELPKNIVITDASTVCVKILINLLLENDMSISYEYLIFETVQFYLLKYYYY